MSNKRELLHHLKKVQSLTSAAPYKSQGSKKKTKKSGLKQKSKNAKVDDELEASNYREFSYKNYRKDSDMDFFYSLFDREKEYKTQMGKIKTQIYFIRWCHSYEIKVSHRKHPKYYYNPNILSYVDQFPSTYQEPSIQLRDPPKISQLPLQTCSYEKISDAVKRVSQAHRKSIREKEIQAEKERKLFEQPKYVSSQEMQDQYQEVITNLDETQNYDEDLLRFTSQLLSNRAKSIKKQSENASQNKYSTKRGFNSKSRDNSSVSTESTSSRLNNYKTQKSKDQTKSQLKVSAPFELHAKRKKKSNTKSTSIVDSNTNYQSTSSNSKTNSKLKLDTTNSIDFSSEINSKEKDNFFDFDPFAIGKIKNTQSSLSSESNSQNQKFKLMQIEQSVISIKPDKLQIVSISDQDLSLPPSSQKASNKSFQFTNNDISVPPSQEASQAQVPNQIQSTFVSLSESSLSSKNKNESLQNILNTTNSQTDKINNQSKNLTQKIQSNQVSQKSNVQNKDDINLDEDSSEIDFDFSELKLPKSIKTNKNQQTQKRNLKSTEKSQESSKEISNINQFNFLPDNSLFKDEKNAFPDLNLNSNNSNQIKASKNHLDSNDDTSNLNKSNEMQQLNHQKLLLSSDSSKKDASFSKLSDMIIEEEEEESEELSNTEIRKEANKIIINNSNIQKETKIQSSDDLDEEIQFNSQEENPSKIQISFNEQIKSKEKVQKASNIESSNETEDEVKLEIDLRKDTKANKKANDFNLKDILPLSILDEILHNSSNNEEEEKLNSDNLFTSDEEKIIQSYLSNENDDDDNDDDDQKVVQKNKQNIDDDIFDKIDKKDDESSGSIQNTPPSAKKSSNQKSSPLSISSGYDDESSSSESYIDKLKKIFPNLDID